MSHIRILILLANNSQKEISSTSGMQQSVQTSELIRLRNEIALARIRTVLDSLRALEEQPADSQAFNTLAETIVKVRTPNPGQQPVPRRLPGHAPADFLPEPVLAADNPHRRPHPEPGPGVQGRLQLRRRTPRLPVHAPERRGEGAGVLAPALRAGGGWVQCPGLGQDPGPGLGVANGWIREVYGLAGQALPDLEHRGRPRGVANQGLMPVYILSLARFMY